MWRVRWDRGELENPQRGQRDKLGALGTQTRVGGRQVGASVTQEEQRGKAEGLGAQEETLALEAAPSLAKQRRHG